MTGHGRRFGWSGIQLGRPPHSEGKHRRDEHLPAMGVPQGAGRRFAVRITKPDLRSRSQLDSWSPSGSLGSQAALSLGGAVVSAGAGMWFGVRTWRLASSAACTALAVVWAAILAFAVWYGLRTRRAILADPWGYLARARRRSRAMRRTGTRSGFSAGSSGTGELLMGISILVALTKRRAAVTDQQPRRSPAVHGGRLGLSLGGYLLVTVITIGLSTPFFFDSSVNPRDFGWSIVGEAFAPGMFLGALALWKCHMRAAAAGQGAEPPASGGAAGPSQPVSLTKPENLSRPGKLS
jgi:hypothetical protein